MSFCRVLKPVSFTYFINGLKPTILLILVRYSCELASSNRLVSFERRIHNLGCQWQKQSQWHCARSPTRPRTKWTPEWLVPVFRKEQQLHRVPKHGGTESERLYNATGLGLRQVEEWADIQLQSPGVGSESTGQFQVPPRREIR